MRNRLVVLVVLVLGALMLAVATALTVEQLTTDDEPNAEAFEAPALP